MAPKKAHYGKSCKITTFFSYMQARANFFIFFNKVTNFPNGHKKGG